MHHMVMIGWHCVVVIVIDNRGRSLGVAIGLVWRITVWRSLGIAIGLVRRITVWRSLRIAIRLVRGVITVVMAGWIHVAMDALAT